ncbi:glycosyltransferase family 4 protein [Aquimarina sp. RZ0]|uniref:glycosyltransferase family 4 protein n=1 Tax=Aquimarina sp. RZ0 TaxID=2607730 RepID=UPI0011F0A3CE|nr:glycosyltransferase family 4 protein [Aquimarina sp. RZ0]KAA1246939.1 glycosyltransferase family 4 protein [Aquimarina sp. RZ0]
MGKIIRITTVPKSLGGLLKGQLKFMSDYYEVVGITSKGDITDGVSDLDQVAQQEGIRVIPVEMTRKITPIKDLVAVYKLYKIFKTEKPVIVHSHTPKAGTLSMIAARFANVPHRLHTIAGLPLLEATGAKRKLLDFVEKITYACATKIYPNSFGLNDIILENKYTVPQKLKVIANGSSNGIDTSHFDPKLYSGDDNNYLKKKLHIEASDIVFIFVGRLVKDKGINELINAFKRINSQFQNVKLLLVGSYEKELDPLFPESEKEIDSNPNIISVGWQNDVRPYFAISDILTFPSYREGFPNVVMQAGSMGLVSIVTNINGCNEIISDGVNGTIIPTKDTEALFKSMEKFIIDIAYKNQLSVVTRTTICNNYERKYVWEALLEEYKQL